MKWGSQQKPTVVVRIQEDQQKNHSPWKQYGLQTPAVKKWEVTQNLSLVFLVALQAYNVRMSVVRYKITVNYKLVGDEIP